MAQKVLFPGTHMRITQDEYSAYSHAGSLARDDGGESTAFDSPVLEELGSDGSHPLDRVSFTVEPGEVMGIVGANGSGKSTLLKLIAGVLAPTAVPIWPKAV